jgi:hypothetical protein
MGVRTLSPHGCLFKRTWHPPNLAPSSPSDSFRVWALSFSYHVVYMKTLLNQKGKQEIIARLQAVRPTSPRLWGKMSVHQMVCHLTDGFRMYMGLKPVRPVPVPYPRSLLKWIALWVPIPWPKGFKTAPELDQRAGGTPPVEFDNDLRELMSFVGSVMRPPRDFQSSSGNLIPTLAGCRKGNGCA